MWLGFLITRFCKGKTCTIVRNQNLMILYKRYNFESNYVAIYQYLFDVAKYKGIMWQPIQAHDFTGYEITTFLNPQQSLIYSCK